MAAVVEHGCEQQFQPFISDAPWRHEPVIAQIARDADRLLGGKPGSALIIDESRFVKHGDRSVGVARTMAGRQDRKSTRLNSSHLVISYAVFCLKKKNK